MSLLGNILWIFLGGGFLIFMEYMIGGLMLCLTIIGIPFGVQCFKIAILGLLPFGRDIADASHSPNILSVMMNIIWIVVGGIWIAVTHLVLGLLLLVTIIGIPFAKQHAKLASLSMAPFGRRIE